MKRQIFRANGVLINMIHVASPLSVQAHVAISRKKAGAHTSCTEKGKQCVASSGGMFDP